MNVKQINIKFLAIQFIAITILATSFGELSTLIDIELVKMLKTEQGWKAVSSGSNLILLKRLSDINYIDKVAFFSGACIAFIALLLLSRKKGRLWINPAISFVLVLVLYTVGLFKTKIVTSILFLPREIFKTLPIQYIYLGNGVILLTVGALLIYWYAKVAGKYK